MDTNNNLAQVHCLVMWADELSEELQDALRSGDLDDIRAAADDLKGCIGGMKRAFEPLVHRLEAADFDLDPPKDDSRG